MSLYAYKCKELDVFGKEEINLHKGNAKYAWGNVEKTKRKLRLLGWERGLTPEQGILPQVTQISTPAGIKRGKTQIKPFYILFMVLCTLYLQLQLLEVTDFSDQD